MATVEGADPAELLQEVADAKDAQRDDARELFDWFTEYEGQLLPAADAVPAAADDLDWPLHRVHRALVGLTDDSMDPVQTVYSPEEQYVGLLAAEGSPTSSCWSNERRNHPLPGRSDASPGGRRGRQRRGLHNSCIYRLHPIFIATVRECCV